MGTPVKSYTESKTREEKLVDTIVTSGGVRLQPARDAIQFFLGKAAKLDAVPLSLALESKLQSPSWQVLSILDGGQTGTALSHLKKPVKSETASVVEMPDLKDTSDSNNDYGTEDYAKNKSDINIENLTVSTTPLIDDIFGDSHGSGASTSEQKAVDDPFADVSFHTSESKEHVDDFFQGITIDKNGAAEIHAGAHKKGPELFDIFGTSSALPPIQGNHAKDVNDLVAGLSVNENASKFQKKETSTGELSGSIFSETNVNPNHKVSNDALKGTIGSQTVGANVNATLPMGSMLYNMPPGIMFNQAFPSQTVNYGAVG